MMRYAATPLSLDLGAGVLIGFGLSGSSFNLVLSAFSKLLPPERRGSRLAPAPRQVHSGNSCSRRSASR